MTLRLKVTAGKAVFEFEEDGMKASWELSPKEDGPQLVTKLAKLLAFLEREKLGTVRNPLAARQVIGPFDDAIYRGPAANSVTLTGPQLDKHVPQFTGVPPIQPPDLTASLARATSNGWELYTGEDD